MARQTYGAVLEEWPLGARWQESDVRDALEVAYRRAREWLAENPNARVRSVKLLVARPGEFFDVLDQFHRVAWKVEVEE